MTDQAWPEEVAPGILVSHSSVYSMTSGLVLPEAGLGAPGALLVDPGVLPSEIDRIAALLHESGHHQGRLVLTHSDWDHVSGAGRFATWQVVASDTFSSGASAREAEISAEIARCDALAGETRPGSFVMPRPASLVGSESEIVGAPRLARVFPAPGHTEDSIALLLVDDRILFPGDYLSRIEIPYVTHSVRAYLQTLSHFRRVLASAGGRAPRRIVPGHGPVIEAQEAMRILEEDAAYLSSLVQASSGAFRDGGDEEAALAAACAITPPRAASDAETIRGHAMNAAVAASEAAG